MDDNDPSRASRPSREFTSEHEEMLTRIDQRVEHFDETVTSKLEEHEEELADHDQRISENDNRSRKNRTLINIATGGIGTILALSQAKIQSLLSAAS